MRRIDKDIVLKPPLRLIAPMGGTNSACVAQFRKPASHTGGRRRCELLERAPEIDQKPEGHLVFCPVNSCDDHTIPHRETVCRVPQRLNRLDKLTTQCDECMALSFS